MSISKVPLLERLNTSAYIPGDVTEGLGFVIQPDAQNRLCGDLALLFNSTGLGATQDLQKWPHVTRSVLNYGLGSLAGVVLSSIDLKSLESRIRVAVLVFEPRIIRQSLDVQLLPARHNSSLDFLIQGEMYDLNLIRPFRMQSIWDTQTGEVRVQLFGRDYHFG